MMASEKGVEYMSKSNISPYQHWGLEWFALVGFMVPAVSSQKVAVFWRTESRIGGLFHADEKRKAMLQTAQSPCFEQWWSGRALLKAERKECGECFVVRTETFETEAAASFESLERAKGRWACICCLGGRQKGWSYPIECFKLHGWIVCVCQVEVVETGLHVDWSHAQSQSWTKCH